MCESKSYCPKCELDREYGIFTTMIKRHVNGKELTINGHSAVCKTCGTVIDVPSLAVSNVKALKEAYYAKYGIIAIDEIQAIADEYDVSMVDLLKVLDIPETELEAGFSRASSSKLREARTDSRYFERLLQSSWGKLVDVDIAHSQVALLRKSSPNAMVCKHCLRAAPCLRIDTYMQYDSIYGEQVVHKTERVYCRDCGARIYNAKTEESNLQTLFQAYREAKVVIPSEAIRALPVRYGIDAANLARVLDIPEARLQRYLAGDPPTVEDSEVLTKVFNSQQTYKSMLRKHRALLSPEVYEHSMSVFPAKQNQVSGLDEVKIASTFGREVLC